MELLKNGFEVLGLVFMNNDFFKSFAEKVNSKKDYAKEIAENTKKTLDELKR